MFDFVWILFGELDADGRFRPIAWNLSQPDGSITMARLDTHMRSNWVEGDRMAYYPLTA